MSTSLTHVPYEGGDSQESFRSSGTRLLLPVISRGSSRGRDKTLLKEDSLFSDRPSEEGETEGTTGRGGRREREEKGVFGSARTTP